MTKFFNLIDEPWIPVRTVANQTIDASLSDVLLHSKEYAEIAETSPPNLIALYRLLLVIIHRALTKAKGKWTDDDRVHWFQNGLPEEALRAYLEEYKERFWLFHPEYPFMQVPVLAEAEETQNKLKPWTQITLERVSGDSPIIFDHSSDDHPCPLSFGQACRNLLGFLQFVSGGLVRTFKTSDCRSALANTAAIIPIGSTLAETLVLALHPSNDKPHDLPPWEQPPPHVLDLKAPPKCATGINNLYVRLSRAVLFEPILLEGCIRQIRYGAGLALAKDSNALDPMAAYCVKKNGKTLPISFEEGRAIWRDLPSLIPGSGSQSSSSPAVINWATNLYNAMGEWKKPLSVLTAGVTIAPNNDAKILRWRIEKIDFPRLLISNPDALLSLRNKIEEAENVYRQINEICIQMIACILSDSDRKETKAQAKLIVEAGPGAGAFFSTVERSLPNLMCSLAQGQIEKAYQEWNSALHLAAKNAWNANFQIVGHSSSALKAEAKFHPKFILFLNKIKGSNKSNALEKNS